MKVSLTNISNQCFGGTFGEPIKKDLAQFKPVLSNYPQYGRAVKEATNFVDKIDFINEAHLKIEKDPPLIDLEEHFNTLNKNLKDSFTRLKIFAIGKEYDKNERINVKPFVRHNYYPAKIEAQQYENNCLNEVGGITDEIAKLNKQVLKNMKLNKDLSDKIDKENKEILDKMTKMNKELFGDILDISI